MKVLKAIAVVWLALCLWLFLRHSEPAAPDNLPWMEVRPTISFSGDWLAFEVDPLAEAVFGRYPKKETEIALVDRSTNTVKRLSFPGISLHAPCLSGKGDQMVFEGAPGMDFLSDVYLADTETLQSRPLAPPQRKGGQGGAFVPTISSNGQIVSFLSYRYKTDPTRPWETTVTMGPPDRLENPFPPLVGRAAAPIALSPDGKRVAWESRMAEPTGKLRVRLFTASDKQQPRVLEQDAWEPSLSAEQLAFVQADKNGTYQIYLHDFISKQTRQLTRGNDDSFEPSISNDGKTLAFTSYATDLVQGKADSTSDIYLMNLEDKSVNCLTAGGDGNSYNPALSGDGSTVAFASLATNLQRPESLPRGQVYVWERGWQQCKAVPFRAGEL